ncbi:hypothetical protein HBH56_132410 [Parastagonospora nodorum]|uniref:Uncharacterized protein n=1 Tax=Phaeosphaeria nodorum (strain SN15 / ATCC MYA-4574 / FGSC 10173) TaxID=321614 RepID=A0A7U2FCP1_PHANO|nr:hypothetical protein HBH56_132410 [Parastagonospora nodorum]QRD02817.1 hypothetical protein JI435_418720 [Parastagonospora nodorum SN15]KAH3949531.1 hypothetical protein HBH53_087370 [Parastagonospora nodorum]KAH4048288.1 hypothetical protein HBH49_156320 [Parastagonospora nodorum]KAH4086020.1 hypothetical protein HBH48_145110 [Parastagonospora nodorum]
MAPLRTNSLPKCSSLPCRPSQLLMSGFFLHSVGYGCSLYYGARSLKIGNCHLAWRLASMASFMRIYR